MKSGVHTTVGRIHTGSAGVAEVAEVGARSRGRIGAREKFGSGVEMAGFHTGFGHLGQGGLKELLITFSLKPFLSAVVTS